MLELPQHGHLPLTTGLDIRSMDSYWCSSHLAPLALLAVEMNTIRLRVAAWCTVPSAVVYGLTGGLTNGGGSGEELYLAWKWPQCLIHWFLLKSCQLHCHVPHGLQEGAEILSCLPQILIDPTDLLIQATTLMVLCRRITRRRRGMPTSCLCHMYPGFHHKES